MVDYQEFLSSKFQFSQSWGFDLFPEDLPALLKPHQKDIVCWAAKRGRAAIFAAFGLGKSLMQICLLQAIRGHKGGAVLVIAPLGVRQEFIRDAAMVGVTVKFIRSSAEVTGPGFYITNYESVRDGKLDVNLFTAVSLDEASVLRSYGSKTYQEFLTLFGSVAYRFVATATPSPNRHKELIHYAGFLGIMDTGQALTRFFQRDSTQANNLTLYPHMEREFYTWLHSWAIFIQTPSDLGYSDEGYDLPPLTVRFHEVSPLTMGGKVNRDGQIQLVNDAALGLKDAAEEKRNSIGVRICKVAELLEARPDDHVILWHDLEDERHTINELIPYAVDVFGSQDMDEREDRIRKFSDGEIARLSTKPEIAGSGCNFQRYCHWAIFCGIGYKFNDFIQAIFRLQRFQQQFPVEIDIIYTETERAILEELKRKWEEDKILRRRMSEIIRKYGLSTAGMESELCRTIGVERKAERGEHFDVFRNDCIDETARMEADSVDLIHTSIPFGNHYEYSTAAEDFGHNEDNAAFFRQMDFLTPNLLRILRPGRVAAIHVKDRIRFGNVTGYGMPTVEPFHADCIAHYIKHGFKYFGMITISTDVVAENNQTYRLSYKELKKDGTKMGVGSPEYVLLFRKLPTDTSNGYADVPVPKDPEAYTLAEWQMDAHAFWKSNGNRLMTIEELAELPPYQVGKVLAMESVVTGYDHERYINVGKALGQLKKLPTTWMALAPASEDGEVWTDVSRIHTLNGKQVRKGLVNHICPLQFDIVDRIIKRYTNPGEVVFDPFGGLMTVPYRAVQLGRHGQACELNADYFRDGVRYLREAESERDVPTLFDSLVFEEGSAA